MVRRRKTRASRLIWTALAERSGDGAFGTATKILQPGDKALSRCACPDHYPHLFCDVIECPVVEERPVAGCDSPSPLNGERAGVRGGDVDRWCESESIKPEPWVFPPLIRPSATFSPLRGEGMTRAHCPTPRNQRPSPLIPVWRANAKGDDSQAFEMWGKDQALATALKRVSGRRPGGTSRSQPSVSTLGYARNQLSPVGTAGPHPFVQSSLRDLTR